MDNANSPEYLEKIKNQVIENLKRTTFAPSVQMTDVPRDPDGMDDEADAILDDQDEDENMDTRHSKRRWEKYVEKDGELSESEDENENTRNGVRQQTSKRKRRNILDYQNANAISDDEKEVDIVRRVRSQDSDEVNGASEAPAANESANSESSENSLHEDDTAMADADEEDLDEAIQVPTATIQQADDGPQQATPPESPLTAATSQPPVQATADPGNSALDEENIAEEQVTVHESGTEEQNEEKMDAERVSNVETSENL